MANCDVRHPSLKPEDKQCFNCGSRNRGKEECTYPKERDKSKGPKPKATEEEMAAKLGAMRILENYVTPEEAAAAAKAKEAAAKAKAAAKPAAKGAAAEEGSDDGDAAEGDSDDGGEGDTADTSSSAASPPETAKGIWWVQRGGCYQAKRKIAYEDGEPCYEWKRFKPESESIEHLCAAHEDARQWAAGGI